MNLLVSIAGQTLTVVDENGAEIRQYSVSTAGTWGYSDRNSLGCVDTMRRYVSIHGSPDSAEIGVPGSHGCVRMRNADIVELFDLVPRYAEVAMTED